MKLKDKIQHQLNIGFSLNEIYLMPGEEGFTIQITFKAFTVSIF